MDFWKFNKLNLRVYAKAYLVSSGISTMKLFLRKQLRALAVNHFRKKASLQIFNWVLNTSLLYGKCVDYADK